MKSEKNSCLLKFYSSMILPCPLTQLIKPSGNAHYSTGVRFFFTDLDFTLKCDKYHKIKICDYSKPLILNEIA